MGIGTIVSLTILAIVLVYAVFIYNGLVSLKHGVSKARSNIQVLLKQRHDELPKLIEVCRQYMEYEKDTLQRIVEARSQVMKAGEAGDMGALGRAESQLRIGLGELFAVAENYPQLKADEGFQHLRSRISQLENSISDRREVYNESVNLNNVRIEQIPDVLLARAFEFGPFQLLRYSSRETGDVDVRKLFSA